MKEEDSNKVSIEKDINARDDELLSYKDEYIDLSSQGLKIKKYYFPTLSEKIIPINRIKNINLIELGIANGKYKMWGLNLNFIYYHLDGKRSKKTHVITLEEEGNFLTIGITPEDPKKCFDVLRYLISDMKKEKSNKLYEDNEQLLKIRKQKVN